MIIVLKYIILFVSVAVFVSIFVNVTFMLLYDLGSACELPITADVLC